jgi:Cu-processing system ATP-binding protein
VISIKHLTKRFGHFCAVDDVSFDVASGEIFAILGPNGSGKTTILKSVAGLLSPSAGQVLVDRLDAWEDGVKARQRFSYLPQRVAFPEMLTAREILEFYCKLRRLPRVRVAQALADSQFNGFGERPVREFSGGMLQRLGIAVLSLDDTPVLLLDEPTTGLDPEASLHLREFLISHRQNGKAILFTSHLLSEVEEVADRVAILVHGRLVAVESMASLRQHLMAARRIEVLLLNPEQRFVVTAQRAGAIAAELRGSYLLVTSRSEDRLSILQALEATGAHIERFSTEEPSLQEIYLRYVYESAADSHLADDRMPVRDASPCVH